MKSPKLLMNIMVAVVSALCGFLMLSCSGGDSTDTDGVGASVAALSNPWANKDIGSPALAGSASDDGTGTFSVKGGGTDIYGTSDAFQFVYKSISGNAELIAQVQSVSNTNGWAKAGVMIRETLNPGSKEMMVALTPGNGVTSQKRTATSGTTSVTSGGAANAPYYVKINRTGSTITTSKSADGIAWTTIESATISMNAAAYMGLAVTAHNNAALCTAKLKVITPATGPVITTQPKDIAVTVGSTVTFTVAATGTGTLKYQWYQLVSGAAYKLGTGTSLTISGATGPGSPTPPFTNSYYCVVTDGAGHTVQSRTATLTVNPLPAPTITQQPQSVTACNGSGTATFAVAASGASLSYQWHQLVQGAPYKLSTGPSLSISLATGPGSPTPPFVNSYYCVVTNGSGLTTQSNTVTLTVNPIPSQVQIQLWGQDSTHVWAQLNSPDGLGITYRYSYDYGNTWSPWENDGYSYFWPYVGPLGYPPGAIEVQAYVTNSYGCASTTVQGAYLPTPPAPPSITTQPQDIAVCEGSSATFTVAATGTATLSYQWYQLSQGVTYPITAGASLSISTNRGPGSPTPPYTNSYYSVVTDGTGTTTQSRTATLTVNPNPSPVEIQLWGQTSDHVWAQLNSPDGLSITYRYSYDFGNTWSPWENDGYSYFWPYVGPLGYPSGAIEVQAYVTNGYGCSSASAQGAYTF